MNVYLPCNHCLGSGQIREVQVKDDTSERITNIDQLQETTFTLKVTVCPVCGGTGQRSWALR